LDEITQEKPVEDAAEEVIDELAKAQVEAAEYLDSLQRIQAEFANYKKRIERERGEFIGLANAALITKLLPILDDLERALKTAPSDIHGSQWLEGIRLIERGLRSILEQEGLSEIEAVDKEFDPQLHHAVVREETSEYPEDQIIGELQKGYKLQDRVLRPSMVIVAAKPSDRNEQERS
jgi:molecular chaperone GrpE